VGNPATLYSLLGSYVPLARTKAEREARHDPRLSIEERYRDREDYLQRIKAAAASLVRDRFLLQEDVEDVVQRATRHWTYATATTQTN
jgi:phage shock protein A